MATLFYGINVGADASTVTIGSTTTGKDVEVAVNSTANVPTRDALKVALDKLSASIDANAYTPI